MFQRIFPFLIPTSCRARAWRNGSTLGVACLALMCAVLLVPLAPARAQVTVVHEDFEDGKSSHTDMTSMKVPPKIMEENGNKFMRITGSPGDCDAIPAEMCPEKNRSSVTWTSHYSQMPLVTSSNMRQTYSARVRFVSTTGPTGYDGKFFSLSVYAPGGDSYGTQNGTGPNLSIWRDQGRVGGYAPYANETKATYFDLGPIAQGTWHTYTVKAVWSHDPSVGRLDIYLDGVLKKTISGRDIFLGPESNRLPMFRTGRYGEYAYGQLDVDDIHVYPTGATPPPPPPPPPVGGMMAVNAGGSQYTGTDGTVYKADAGYSGGGTYTTTAAIAGTADDRLYQSWRSGNFSYAFPVANGDYLATLKFAENRWTQVGQRVFNVSMEGKAVLSNLDVFAKVGPKAAYDVTLPVTVSDGVLRISFQPVVGNAMVSGIKFEPKSASVSAPTAPINVRVVSGQ
jgi:Malectin domain/Polysaccharide lyase